MLTSPPADFGTAPAGQAHVGLLGVGALADDLGGGVAGDGPVQLVLNCLKELNADVLCRVVIEAGRVDVGDFLIEAPLRRADVLNPPQQLFEVVEWLVGILQPLVVHDEAFDDELAQLLGRPDAKARRRMTGHAVTNRDDRIQAVEAGTVLLPVAGSSKENLYYCFFSQFPFGKDVLQVLADVLLAGLKKLGHVLLRQPHRLALQPHVELQLPVLSLIDQKLPQLRRGKRGLDVVVGHGRVLAGGVVDSDRQPRSTRLLIAERDL